MTVYAIATAFLRFILRGAAGLVSLQCFRSMPDGRELLATVPNDIACALGVRPTCDIILARLAPDMRLKAGRSFVIARREFLRTAAALSASNGAQANVIIDSKPLFDISPVTAAMRPAPRGNTYLMPVGSIARLFRKHNGTQGITVKSATSNLDIGTSRGPGTVYLHEANLEYRSAVDATISVEGMTITGGRVIEIAPENLRLSVNPDQPKVFQPVEHALASGAEPNWRFRPGAVAAVELHVV
jgi:hypothetical protein